MADFRDAWERIWPWDRGRFPLLVATFGAILGLSTAALIRTNAQAPTTGLKSAPHVVETTPSLSETGPAAVGDPERGLELMEKFECSRCHDSAQLSAPPKERHCTGCHRDIMAGNFQASEDAISHWQSKIKHLIVVPALDHTAPRFRNDWMVEFLQRPHDLRPGLEETMPRLPITASQARDIAAVLAPESSSEVAAQGDADRGRSLYDGRGCANCHEFSGVAARAEADETSVARRLAPDLRHTRTRFLPQNLRAWLRDPSRLVPTTRMPHYQFSVKDADDLAAFVLTSALAEPVALRPSGGAVEIKREVFFEEVETKVFKTTCWHCHSDPDFSMGDEGPGNSGGFGFAGVGLELATYEGVLGGAYPGGATVFDSLTARERTTIVDVTEPSRSRLLRALRARQIEERGGQVPGVRGMPLGLPALSDEDLALVQAWIEQGAKW